MKLSASVGTDALYMQSLQQVHDSSRNMTELIDTLLFISRLEFETQTTTQKEVDVAKPLEDILKDLDHAISKKTIHINGDVTTQEPIITDPILLKAILENLISNAVKYSHHDGAILYTMQEISNGTSIDQHTATSDSLYITITDQGLGIPEHEQTHVFERLFRAGNALEQEIPGHGLGLYIVKLMTEKLRGAIWFDSTENQGTTFHLIIPSKQNL